MILPCYLAMTGAEFMLAERFPSHIGWMACHFSGYGKGLSNLPTVLPKHSLLIVNDEIPISGHDPKQILRELQDTVTNFDCCGILLDFQRPGIAETAALCRFLTDNLSCPVGVTSFYANNLSCPVFLSPPLRKSFKAVLTPWKGREIWLEAAPEAEQATITEAGTTFCDCPLSPLPEPCVREERLHCRYHWASTKGQVIFTTQRTKEDLMDLLNDAAGLGVTKAVGLYQQLRHFSEFL